MAKQFIIFDRRSQTPEDIYGRNQLDQDTTRYFPWVYDTAGGELGWQWWAIHLLEDWAELPYFLAAPPKYDETYYQLKGEQRNAWLAALRRVCNGLFKGAVLPDFDADNGYYPLAIKLNEDYGGLREDLASAIRRGLQKLEEWLNWREQSVITQLMTSLSVVHLAEQKGKISLAHNDQTLEAKRFKALLQELQQRLLAEPTESWLRISHSHFLTFSKLILPIAQVPINELSSAFPSLQLPNLSEVLTLPMSPDFWPEFRTVLTTRVEWANRVATIVGNAIGLPTLPAQGLATSQAKPKAKLSYKQAAMFYYYTNQPLTENNASELAASLGHTSESKGILLMRANALWLEQIDSELSSSKRQLGRLKKDLAIVLPHLIDKPYNEAFKLLKKVAKKYERGL